MIQDIKIAAEACGITAVITNSSERIETQLNRITGIEDLPILLCSWDFETTINFKNNSYNIGMWTKMWTIISLIKFNIMITIT